MKKVRLQILLAVLMLVCCMAIISTGCKKEEPAHTHSFTQWKYDDNQHWKVCADDGEKDETSVEDHIFVAGACECGAHKEAAKYGTVKGKVTLRKAGQFVNDFAGITVDMGDDDVEITGNAAADGYEFTITNVKVGKFYNLTISKQGYQSYNTEVLLEKEDEEAVIGGEKGVALGYDVFGLLCGYDAEYHDFSKVNDDNPCIIFREHPDTKTMNVLTKDSYTNVSASMRIKLQNTTAYMRTQGIVLKFEDGKHIVLRFHNGDLPNGRIQYCNNAWDVCKAEDTLVTGLDQWGEKPIYSLTDAETTACNADGMDLKAVVKDGKVYAFFNDKCLSILNLPAGYADMKVQVGFFAWDTANDAVFPYTITEEIPALPSSPDVYYSSTGGSAGTPSNSVFDLLAGYDGEYHDFSQVGGANPCIIFKEHSGDKTMNVLSKASYNNVSASLNIKYNNSTFYMHTQGIVLKFEDGKHLVIRYHNGDMTNGNIQYCDNAWDVCKSSDSLFGNAGLNQWGEKPIYTLTDQETAAIKAGGLKLNVVLKDGKLYTLFNGKCVATYDLPAGYANKKVRVGFFAWNTANNAVFNYSISTTLPTLSSGETPSYESNVFGLLENYDAEYHDFSQANGANPCIIFKEHSGDKTLNVLTKESYTNVSASMNLEYNNSTFYMHTQGIVLKFEDGKHVIVRYHNGDMANGNIQYVNLLWSNGAENSLFGADAGLNQWGENPVYTLTDQETAAIKAGGLDLTVKLKDGKLYTFFNGRCVATYNLPAGYANKKVQVGYFVFNTANNAVFHYAISDDTSAMQSALKINVTKPEGVDCTVTAAPKKDSYAFGDQITLTFSAPEGYRLEAVKVCGVDRLSDVENGKLTITADRANVEVQVTFAKEKPVTLDLSIQGRKLGTQANLAEGTAVTFKGASGDQVFTVDAQGKIHVSLAKGAYKVSVAGYLAKDITISEGLTELVLEYDTFKDVLGWGSFDFSKQNNAEPEFGITNDCSAIFTNDTYGDVVATIYLKGTNMNQGNAGILFRFVGEGIDDVVTLRMEGRQKVQFSMHDLWATMTDKHNISMAVGTDWQDLIFFNEGDEYLTAFDAGTLKLSAVRKGATIYVFLNDHFVGSRTFDAKYANVKCEAGFITESLGNNTEWKRWKVEISETLPSVKVTDKTAADAHGKVEIAPAAVKFGDTVTITVTPDSGYRIAKLTVNGADVTKDMTGNVYQFAASGNSTVKAEFDEVTTGSIHAEISGKKFGVAGNSLTTETTVELTASGLDTITAALVEENGKLMLNVPELTAANWTVSVAGYKTAEITVARGAEYQDIIVIEYEDIFELVQNWGSIDCSKQNTENKIGVTNAIEAALTKAAYHDAVFSIYMSGENASGVNQGVAFRFPDGSYVCLRMEGRQKIQFAEPDWNMNGGKADGAGWKDLIFFTEGDKYLTAYDAGTLKLTCVRRGNTFYAFLNDQYIGNQTINEKYADTEAKVGFYWYDGGNQNIRRDWKFEFFESIPSVTVTNATEDANGKVEIAPADVKLCDTVTIKVTPNEGYTLKTLLVGGQNVADSVVGGTYSFLATGDVTISAEFEKEHFGTVDAAISGSKYKNVSIDLNGTVVTLANNKAEYSITVTDGKMHLDKVLTGTYTLSAEGYLPTTIEVTEAGYTADTVLVYQLFTSAPASADLSHINEGKIIATGNGGVDLETIEKYVDVIAEGKFDVPDYAQRRYGIALVFDDGKNFRVDFAVQESGWNNILQQTNWNSMMFNWEWVDFPEGYFAQNSNNYTEQEIRDEFMAKGLTYRIERAGAEIKLYINGVLMKTYTLPDAYKDQAARLKFIFDSNGTDGTKGITFDVTAPTVSGQSEAAHQVTAVVARQVWCKPLCVKRMLAWM